MLIPFEKEMVQDCSLKFNALEMKQTCLNAIEPPSLDLCAPLLLWYAKVKVFEEELVKTVVKCLYFGI